jgi:hypothetical protein
MSEREANLDQMKESLERILTDHADELPPGVKPPIQALLERLTHIQTVSRHLEAMQNIVLNPVREALVDQIEESRTSSRHNRYFGWAGIIVGIVGLSVYFIDPLGKDDHVRNISSRLDELENSASGLNSSYVSLSEIIGDIDGRVRTALVERLDPINGTGFQAIDGEQQFLRFRERNLLTNESETIQLKVTRTGIDQIEETRFKYAGVQLFSNGRLFSDERFQDTVSTERLNKDLRVIAQDRWREGDIVTFFGLYKFLVTRIEVKDLGGREMGDANDAMYLQPLETK